MRSEASNTGRAKGTSGLDSRARFHRRGQHDAGGADDPQLLRLDPQALQAVRQEETGALPFLFAGE